MQFKTYLNTINSTTLYFVKSYTCRRLIIHPYYNVILYAMERIR